MATQILWKNLRWLSWWVLKVIRWNRNDSREQLIGFQLVKRDLPVAWEPIINVQIAVPEPHAKRAGERLETIRTPAVEQPDASTVEFTVVADTACAWLVGLAEGGLFGPFLVDLGASAANVLVAFDFAHGD